MSKFVEKIAEWMPLRLQIWRKGTAFFSPAERGAYMDLILAYWELGPLPAEDDVLQQLARVPDPRLWRQVRGKVLAKFHERDGFLHHARIDEERTVAVQKYERRAHAGSAGGKASVEAKSKQTPSNASSNASPDVQANHQAPANTTYQEHSPDGETLANASVTRKPRKARRTRLADDWKPSEADRAYARSVGLTDAEIDAAGVEFSRYWRSADAAGGGLKADWHTTWCANIDRNAAAIIGRRNRAGQPVSNRRGAGSVLAALSTVLDPSHGSPPGVGEATETPPVFTGATASTGPSCRAENPGTASGGGDVIDGEWERVQEASRGDEIPHAAEGGGDRGHSGADRDLRAAPGSVSAGYRAVCDSDADGREPLVAGVERIEGPTGPVDGGPEAQAGGADFEPDVGPMPDFLRRYA